MKEGLLFPIGPSSCWKYLNELNGLPSENLINIFFNCHVISLDPEFGHGSSRRWGRVTTRRLQSSPDSGRKGPSLYLPFRALETWRLQPHLPALSSLPKPPQCLWPLTSTPPASPFLPPLPGRVTLRAAR